MGGLNGQMLKHCSYYGTYIPIFQYHLKLTNLLDLLDLVFACFLLKINNTFQTTNRLKSYKV